MCAAEHSADNTIRLIDNIGVMMARVETTEFPY